MRIQITDTPTINIDTDRTLTTIEQIQSASLLMPTNSGHLIQGDNAEIMRCLLKQGIKIDLIYIDPPYMTNLDFKTKEGKFAYSDKFTLDTYLTMLYERLTLMKHLLSEKGSIYVHVDYRASAYIRLIMDEIFGEENFQREIIWDVSVLSGYKTLANNWIKGHDNILFYTKSKNYTFNKLKQAHKQEYLERFNKVDEQGNKFFDGRGQRRYLYDALQKGKVIGDVWNDIQSFQQQATSKERLGYPTQKPEALLERIIKASSNEGDLVADFFCGSGTTLAVAQKLNRNWIGADMGDESIKTTKERMLNLDSNFTLSNLNK
jgi:adenine specific DNA methylase Mod